MKNYLAVFFCFSVLHTYSQSVAPWIGAKTTSLIGITSVVSSPNAVFNSPADLVNTNEQINTGFISRYGLRDLSSVFLTGSTQFQELHVGIGAKRFGGDLYNEQTIVIGLAHEISIVSLGASLNLNQQYYEGLSNHQDLQLLLSGIAKVHSKFHLGATIHNLTLSKSNGHVLPTYVKTGLGYFPAPPVKVLFEVEKEISSRAIFKTALEYNLNDVLYLRTGVQPMPLTTSFGLGIKFQKFELGYSYADAEVLGSIHGVELSKRFGQ